MNALSGKRVTVAGLGRFGGGIAVARWLCAQGARVLVTDRESEEKLAASRRQLDGLPIAFYLGGHRKSDFTDTDLVVASPAIPLSNPLLAAARQAGVEISTEIRLFIERCPCPIVGITGTKGKSTTTAMLGKILSASRRTWIGGNIGKSLLADLPHMIADDVAVLELSSFMLEYLREMHWSPHVAVVTMIAEDHLDWHGSASAYIDAKKSIVRFQTENDFAVLNESNAMAASLSRETPAHTIFYGIENRKRFRLRLPGEHNQLNAQGAFTAASIFGVDFNAAQIELEQFTGLPHRLQLVHEARGVSYYDDSIATIPDAAVAAMIAFPAKKVIQIVGGSDKKLPITAMCAALSERAKAVLCIGATGKTVAETLEKSLAQNAAPAYHCGDLATALRIAKSIAVAGDVVLLSPGFASYDQFVNFEQRGDEFIRLAKL